MARGIDYPTDPRPRGLHDGGDRLAIRSDNVTVYLATMLVDMCKSLDGLAEHVRAFLGRDPLCGSRFVFRNKATHRVKILWWDHNGLAIYYKRLERGTFEFLASHEKSVAISNCELMRLLSGIQPVARRPEA